MTFPGADVQLSEDTSPAEEASPNPWWDFISSSPYRLMVLSETWVKGHFKPFPWAELRVDL